MKLLVNCFDCNVPMKACRALKDIMQVSLPDFVGQDKNEQGQTMSRSGKVEVVPVWKCPSCGKSVEQVSKPNT